MRYEEDYLMRLIREMVMALVSVVLGTSFWEYQILDEEEERVYTELYRKLLELADAGYINEAENLLLEEEARDKEYLNMAMSFYLHINKYKDDFLEKHDYSREEIMEGIQAMAREYGAVGLEDIPQ